MPDEKTNVMRILDQKKIPYVPHAYPHGDGPVDAGTVAALLGADPAAVFKTLVTRGASGANYVFVIPAPGELDLKKAAKAAGEKSIALIPVGALTALTGYVRGGCSPVGMKKALKTIVDISAEALPAVIVSAGRIGAQVELDPAALAALISAQFQPVVKEAI